MWQEAKSEVERLPAAKCLAVADLGSARQTCSLILNLPSYLLDVTFDTCRKVDNSTTASCYYFCGHKAAKKC